MTLFWIIVAIVVLCLVFWYLIGQKKAPTEAKKPEEPRPPMMPPTPPTPPAPPSPPTPPMPPEGPGF